MTAPTPHFWVDGEFATASDNLNPGVYDPLRFLLDPPRVQAKQITTGQSIANNAFVSVTFNFEDYDNDPTGMHDSASNPSRLTCRIAGTYMLYGGVAFATNSAGRRGIRWDVNGALVQGTQNIQQASSTSGDDRPAKTILVPLAVGDWVEMKAYQDTGAAMTLVVLSPSCSMAGARWMGP